MKKVLVTGAHGFIGRYTVEELLNHGYEVVAFDHHHDALARDWPEGVQVFLGDVTNDVAVTEAMAHADGWIHLAAVLGTQETIMNPRPAAVSNVQGGLNMFEAAAQYGLPGVYICVGNHWMNNTYSISKTTVERFSYMFNKERNTRINNVRVVNAYGPRQLAAAPFGPGKVRKITPAFVCRALSNIPIEVYGSGNQISDMVYVGDVAKTLRKALEAASEGSVFDRVVEVGPSKHSTVKEVAELIADYAHMNYGYELHNIVNLPMRPGEIADSKVTADISTLELVGMSSAELLPIKEGMQKTVDWFEANKGITWFTPGE